MARLIIESLATGASVAAVEKLLCIFPQTLVPNQSLKDRPKHFLIHKCHSTMKVVAEVCSTILLARAKKWVQLSTDGTSVGNLKIQDIVLEIEEEESIRAVLLSAGIVLADGESAMAVCNTIVSAIEGMGTHLTGLHLVMERLHPDKLQTYIIPQAKDMTLSKLVGGHISSDNCAVATATSDNIAAYVTAVAEKEFSDEKERLHAAQLPLLTRQEFHVYFKRWWHHLRCTWVENVRQETNQWMAKTYKDNVEAMKVEFKDDRFSLELINLIRLCEKYFCPKGHDAKSDQFDFWAWMRRPLEEDGTPNPRRNEVLMPLERACSGARQDLATNGCLPILNNLPFYSWFVLDRKRNNLKAANGFIKALDKLIPSVEMQAYIRLMTIYDVAVVRPHRFLAGKAHELHTNENGKIMWQCMEWYCVNV